MKYIIIELNGVRDTLLFGGTISHSDLKKQLGPACEVIGAGICGFRWCPEECGWKVWLEGGSVSLGIEKQEIDKVYIRQALEN